MRLLTKFLIIRSTNAALAVLIKLQHLEDVNEAADVNKVLPVLSVKKASRIVVL